MAASAASALKVLKAVADESHKHVCYSQPEMLPAWQDSYDTELTAAAKAALDAGSNPQVRLWRITHVILCGTLPVYSRCVACGM
jgi:hypothetical protein